MKKMKKLFFSVFALSALILSACSGSEAKSSSSAAGDSSTSQKQSSSEESSAAGESSSGEEGSSAEEESSSAEGSSSEVDPATLADYRIEIGNAVYDLVLDEGQTEYEKQYYFGSGVSKTVTKDEGIVFKKLSNDSYAAFAVEPSPDDAAGWTYNNVSISGDDYSIKESGSVQVYLKQDKTSHEWSFWITGGGAIPKPEEGWYLRGSNISVDWGLDPNYKLEEGTGDDAGKYFINYDAIQGDQFKICHIDDQGKDTWYPYNKGTSEAPEYVGYYKNSAEAQSAIYKGYLYGDKDYNLQTIVPGNYRIDIDPNNNDFGIWTSLNENTDHSPKRTDLMVGRVGDEAHEAAAPFGTLAAGGYKYSITLPLEGLETTDKLYIRWKDNTELIVEPDDEENPSLEKYFVVNDDATLSIKEASTKTIEITFALQCGAMVVSAAEIAAAAFRVKATEGGLTQLYVVGDFNNWTPSDDYKLTEIDTTEHIYQSNPIALSEGEHAFKFYNDAEEGDAKYEYAGDNRTIDVAGSMFTPIYIYGNSEGHVGEYYLLAKKGTNWESTALSPKNENTEYYIENIALEAGQEFKINLDGSWRGFSQIKPSSPAKANFEEAEADDNIKVLTAGNYNIYVKVTPDASGDDAGKSIYIAEYVAPVTHNVTAKVGTDPVELTDIKDAEDTQNVSVYLIELAKDAVISFKDNDADIHFLATDGETSYTATVAGKYFFFYSNDGLMYVSAPVSFSVTAATVESGFSVYVVSDYYGNWAANENYKLSLSEEKYVGTFELPGGENQQYKLIKVKDDEPTVIIWETWDDDDHNDNRVISASSNPIPANLTATFAAYVGPAVYKVLGIGDEADPWAYATNTKVLTVDEAEKPDGVLHQWSIELTLAEGKEFKINDGTITNWYGYNSIQAGGAKSNFSRNDTSGTSEDNVIVNVTGTYKIYVRQHSEYTNFYIAATGTTPVTPVLSAYKVLGVGEGDEAWDYSNSTLVFAVDEDGMPSDVEHQWSVEVTLTQNDEFKINDGNEAGWLGFYSMEFGGARYNFSKAESNDNVVINVAGTYKIYLRQYSYDHSLHFGIVATGTTETNPDPTYKVLGYGGDWTYGTNEAAFTLDEDEKPEGALHQWSIQLELAENLEFKVSDGGTLWLGYDSIEAGGAKANFARNNTDSDSNNNVIVSTAGTYKIYLKQYRTYMNFYIAAVE